MGWNSWDAYGTNVRESEIRAQAEFMARHLRPYGWEYVVVDHQWYDSKAQPGDYVGDWRAFTVDDHGRLQPDPKRFPSSADGSGFKPLADYVHSLGLKFGIHLMRGVPRLAAERKLPVLGTTHTCADIADEKFTCVWNTDMWGVNTAHCAAQAYYDSVAQLLASWEVDFIKADDMMNEPFHAEEIRALRHALDNTGRAIVLSLSPGGGGQTWMAPHLRAHSQMWRISGDLWDNWITLRRVFDLCAAWCWHQRDGAWPDADMLPLGRIGIRAQHGPDRQTRLTRDEQLTLMTLWAIFRSPLIMGGDLPTLAEDPWTLSLLTNPEVLQVNQEGAEPRPLCAVDDLLVWRSHGAKGTMNLAFFNRGDQPVDVAPAWTTPDLGGFRHHRDLWARADLSDSAARSLRLPPHGCALLRSSS